MKLLEIFRTDKGNLVFIDLDRFGVLEEYKDSVLGFQKVHMIGNFYKTDDKGIALRSIQSDPSIGVEVKEEINKHILREYPEYLI